MSNKIKNPIAIISTPYLTKKIGRGGSYAKKHYMSYTKNEMSSSRFATVAEVYKDRTFGFKICLKRK